MRRKVMFGAVAFLLMVMMGVALSQQDGQGTRGRGDPGMMQMGGMMGQMGGMMQQMADMMQSGQIPPDQQEQMAKLMGDMADMMRGMGPWMIDPGMRHHGTWHHGMMGHGWMAPEMMEQISRMMEQMTEMHKQMADMMGKTAPKK